jgi:hypothetical protein
MKTINARLTFLEEILGTSPNSKDIYREYIASKSPDALGIEDEVATVGVDGVMENSMTVFNRDKDGNPFLYDYQIKGFFKDTCGMLSRIVETESDGEDDGTKGRKKKKKALNESGKISAYKKVIDGLIFVFPRQILLNFDGEIGNCQRPLRAQTPQGERVALANSETIPAGATCDIQILCLSDDHEKAIYEWLDYGKLRGLGQWRNSGKGRFSYEILD